jgi:hypothetical protein
MSAVEEQRLWSVTTLIKEGLPKEALTYWAARVTAERAYDDITILQAFAQKQQRDEAVEWLKRSRFEQTRKAAARGTALHEAAEQYALGTTPDVEPHVMPWVEQYRKFLLDFKPQFLAAEAPVYNLTERYAGTMDGVVVIEGQTVLLDVKTHAKDNDAQSRPPYADVALQLVAYARAERVGVDPAQRRNYNGRRYYIWKEGAAWVPMPALDGAVCLAISPFDYELVPVAIDDEVWDAFLATRAVARFQLQTSQRVLGPPLEPSEPSTAFEGQEPPPAPEIPGQLGLESSDAEPPAWTGAEPPPGEPEPAFEGEPPPAPTEESTADEPKSQGEAEFEQFLEESSQATAGDYWERIANFLHAADGPQSTSDIIKGTKSSQGKIRDLLPTLASSGLIVNHGTDARPKWQLKAWQPEGAE